MWADTKKRTACAWAILMLCLLFMGRASDALSTMRQSSVDKSVTTCCESLFMLSNPYDDDLQAKREANRWAMPSAGVTLQGMTGRISPTDVLQRVLRLYGLLQCASNNALSYSRDRAEHIVLSKRFHIGYYIYHRCQMRC